MAGVMGHVDVALDAMTSAGRLHRSETLAWIEDIVAGVRAVRQMRLATAAHARTDPMSASPR
jgi:hypothetical protein